MGNVVVESEDCVQSAPHFDPEGAVCANDGTANEAYCSYEVGLSACARCDVGDEPSVSACPHFGPQNLTVPWSSVVRQAKLLYEEGSMFPESYTTDQVEGSLLILGNSRFSISFTQMQFQVQFVNFDDDWMGASFRYRNEDNYYRFEMSRVFGVARLKRVRVGNMQTIWQTNFVYKKDQFYTLRIEDLTDRISVYLNEGLDGYAPKETWSPICGRISAAASAENNGKQPERSTVCSFQDAETELISGTVALFESGSNGLVYFIDPRVQAPYRVAKHSNFLSRAGHSVTIHGAGFIEGYSSIQARLHFTSAEASSWLSATSMECKSMGWKHPFGGLGGSLQVMITAGKVAGSVTDGMSYDGPNLHEIPTDDSFRQNAASRGSRPMTAHTARYQSANGFAPFYASANFGRMITATEMSLWMSDTSIYCLRARGIRGSTAVSVTSGLLVASLTQAYSVDLVTVSFLGPQNQLATGSASMTVQGSAMGHSRYTIAGRPGDTGNEASTWVSDTMLVCLTRHGARHSTSMVVTSGERGGTRTEVISFDGVGLSSTLKHNWPATGASSMTVLGANMDLQDPSSSMRVARTGCESTEWVSESAVTCQHAAGQGGSMWRLSVTVGERVGSLTDAYWYSMDAPSVSQGFSNTAATGSGTVSIIGGGLGHASLTAGGRVGVTASEETRWVSDHVVICQVAQGISGSWKQMLTVGRLVGSLSEAVSFDGGLSSLTHVNQAGHGTMSLTVHGRGLGPAGVTAAERAGMTSCEATEWQADTALRCLVSKVTGKTRRVSFTAGRHVGTLSQIFSVDVLPLISGTRPDNRAGSSSYFEFGAGLVGYHLTTRAAISHTTAESTEWISDSSLFCKHALSIRGSMAVSVTSGLLVASLTQAYSVDLVTVSFLGPQNQLATGSASMTVQGSAMGHSRYTIAGRPGDTGNEASTWVSDTMLVCLTRHGARHSTSMVVTSGERGGTRTEVISFDSISLSSMVTQNSPVTGSGTVSIIGGGLGHASLTAGGRVGVTACEETKWVSETYVICKAAAGVRQMLSAQVTSSVGVSTLSEVFSFDKPELGSLFKADGSPSSSGGPCTLVDDNTCAGSLIGAGDTVYCENVWGTPNTVCNTDGKCVAPANCDFTATAASSPETEWSSTGGNVTILGQNFGTHSATLHVSVGDTQSPKVEWTSDSSVSCSVPAVGWSGSSCSAFNCRIDHPVVVQVNDISNQGATVFSDSTCDDSNSSWSDIRGHTCADYASNAEGMKNIFDCSRGGVIVDQTGTITDGTGAYGKNAQCSWIVSPASSAGLKIMFQQLKTEESSDHVRVWSCADASCIDQSELTLSGSPWSGTAISLPMTLETDSGHVAMRVEFYSNGDDNSQEGFVARFAEASAPQFSSMDDWWTDWCEEESPGQVVSSTLAKEACCACRRELPAISYSCPVGYHKAWNASTDGYYCEDIDECGDGHTCDMNQRVDELGYYIRQAACTNTAGSFSCDCIPPYSTNNLIHDAHYDFECGELRVIDSLQGWLTVSCSDDAAWTDGSGDGCEWYNTASRCDSASSYEDAFGDDASTKCCFCGGGIFPADTMPTTCKEDDTWIDSTGDGCEWYNTASRCGSASEYADAFGDDASMKCCFCGGGTSNVRPCTWFLRGLNVNTADSIRSVDITSVDGDIPSISSCNIS